MNPKSFEYLELIPELFSKIKNMEERMQKLTPPITSKKDVAKFLQRSESTVNRYMSDGLLIEGQHYYRKNGKILVFIEDAIIEFRHNLSRGLIA